MRNYCYTLLTGLFLALMLAQSAWADQQLTSSWLRSRGIDHTSLQPIAFSHDDRQIAAFSKANFEKKKEGIFFHLWFFQVNRDGSFGDVRSVDVPLKSLQQGEFTPDDSSFILIGDRGTSFYKVDLKTYTLAPLFLPEWGESGFRADPAVMWTEAGHLYVLGHPYDKERFVESKTVAELRPNAPGGQIFERGADLSTLEKGIERLWMTSYSTGHSAFFAQKYPQTTLVSYWDGSTLREFARGWKFSGFWNNAGRLLYTVRQTEGAPSQLQLYDSTTQRITTIAEADKSYLYLFLSRNGKVALTSQASETVGRLVPFFAREKDNWELKPVVTDGKGQTRTIPSGWMRLSSSGNLVAHFGPNGATLFRLP